MLRFGSVRGVRSHEPAEIHMSCSFAASVPNRQLQIHKQEAPTPKPRRHITTERSVTHRHKKNSVEHSFQNLAAPAPFNAFHDDPPRMHIVQRPAIWAHNSFNTLSPLWCSAGHHLLYSSAATGKASECAIRTIMPPPRMLRFDTGNLTEAWGAGAARNPVSDAFWRASYHYNTLP